MRKSQSKNKQKKNKNTPTHFHQGNTVRCATPPEFVNAKMQFTAFSPKKGQNCAPRNVLLYKNYIFSIL